MKKHLRSPLLSSKVAAKGMDDSVLASGGVQFALGAIDKLGDLFDALAVAQQTINPQETPEARAKRYEKQFQASVAKVERTLDEAMARLNSQCETIREAGIYRAGLSAEPKDAQEIRAALRQMTPKERDKAISEAFDRNDADVLSAIRASNPVTWGGSSMPLAQMYDAYIDRVTPELVKQRDALTRASQSLKLATEAFFNGADEWRDPLAAAKGEAQKAEFEKADAALQAHLND